MDGPGPALITPCAVRAALSDLLQSEDFARSPQLSNFLRYVVEKSLSGDDASIKAYSIAVDVFGRPESFDPQSDPIVRVQARRLRDMLDRYYAAADCPSDIVITIPVGGYTPAFSRRDPITEPRTAGMTAEPVGQPEMLRARDAARRTDSRDHAVRRHLRHKWPKMAAAIVVVVLMAVAGYWAWSMNTVQPSASGPGQKLHVAVDPFTISGDRSGVGFNEVLRLELASLLSRFGIYEVSIRASGRSAQAVGLRLGGLVKYQDGTPVGVTAFVMEAPTRSIIWSGFFAMPDTLAERSGASSAVGREIAAQVGGANGPLRLRAAGAQDSYGTAVRCLDAFDRFRIQLTIETETSARTCLDQVANAQLPLDAFAKSAGAFMDAWRMVHERPTGEVGLMTLAVQVDEARDAIRADPDQSFHHEQLAAVLALGGATESSIVAFNHARSLNPANAVATASLAQTLAMAGRYEDSALLADEARRFSNAPPDWLYLAEATERFAHGRYEEAMEAAMMARYSSKLVASIIITASAALLGRDEMAAECLQLLIADDAVIKLGALTAMSGYIKDRSVLEAAEKGLVRAGLPARLLWQGERSGTPVGSVSAGS
ncbi:hypothetical protein [Cucumibacter marinus]|uniref:hypothetical protein n=1 Tax=Cucumibacter marinus TaxID=1121252 RepID=UPI000429BC18|nr:hypothetical protein [Cucumibacter marinus]